MNFTQKYQAIVAKNNSLVCVGLDSEVNKIPAHLKGSQFEFNKAIIDATHDLVCAYKPNSAFYEANGVDGIGQLKQTLDYLKKKYPGIPVILDAKRADIGNTNNGYVAFAFDYLGVDAITLHPYLGRQALQPFLDRKDAFSFVLCRTSNPGAGELQDLVVTRSQSADQTLREPRANSTEKGEREVKAGRINNKSLYQFIAQKVSSQWNDNNNCGLVVSATYPEELAIVRKITGDEMIFLIPGVGAQGGDVEKTVKAGLNFKKAGIIINSSRGIIFASNGPDFTQKAREETLKLRDEINKYRS